MIRETAAALFSPEIEASELALALLLGPLLAGLLVGSVLRQLRGRVADSKLSAIALLLIFPTAVGLIGTRLRLGVWDGASIGLLTALGLVAGLYAWHRRARELLLAVAASALALGAAEWTVRAIAPPPPGFRAIEGAVVFLPRVDLEHLEPARGDFAEHYGAAIDGCALLFPDFYPAHVAERTARARAAQGSVVYLGDSMTYGHGVPMQSAFPALLEEHDPRRSHVNLGFPGTSTDYHYVIARRWLDHLPPPVELVVLGLYFNDILEIGQAMPCCGGRSLLVFENGGMPMERCTTPEWVAGYGQSLGWFLRHSPSPYPLRAAMEFSHIARYVEAVRAQRSAWIGDQDRPLGGSEWDRIRDILTALHKELNRRDVPHVALMLPSRAALEAIDPSGLAGHRDARRLVEMASHLGIRTFDPWEHFRSLVQRDGSARYFIGDDDIHLSPEGHDELARWLAANVDELGTAPQ